MFFGVWAYAARLDTGLLRKASNDETEVNSPTTQLIQAFPQFAWIL
jgi:hypothetical protein